MLPLKKCQVLFSFSAFQILALKNHILTRAEAGWYLWAEGQTDPHSKFQALTRKAKAKKQKLHSCFPRLQGKCITVGMSLLALQLSSLLHWPSREIFLLVTRLCVPGTCLSKQGPLERLTLRRVGGGEGQAADGNSAVAEALLGFNVWCTIWNAKCSKMPLFSGYIKNRTLVPLFRFICKDSKHRSTFDAGQYQICVAAQAFGPEVKMLFCSPAVFDLSVSEVLGYS